MANSNPFIQYYVNQSGGDFNVFRGYKYQRGSGFGSFFSSLFRRVSPLAKSLGSVIGKTLLNTGSNIAADSFSGKNWKDSTRNHLSTAGKNILSESINTIKSQYGLGRKRKRAPSKTSNKKRKVVVTKKKTSANTKAARFRAALKKNFEKYPLFSHGFP
jgi:hypothetical protein